MRFAAFLCASLALANAALAQETRWSGHGISLMLPEGWRATTDPARSEIALIARSLPMEASGHTCEVAVIAMAGLLPHDQALLNDASAGATIENYAQPGDRATSFANELVDGVRVISFGATREEVMLMRRTLIVDRGDHPEHIVLTCEIQWMVASDPNLAIAQSTAFLSSLQIHR